MTTSSVGPLDAGELARLANELFRGPSLSPAPGATLGGLEQPGFDAALPQAPDAYAPAEPGLGGGTRQAQEPAFPTDPPPAWNPDVPELPPLVENGPTLFGLPTPEELLRLTAPPLLDAGSAAQGFYFLAGRTSAPSSAFAGNAPARFDFHRVRRDFPILSERVNGRPLVWLDNAATTQKPRQVIERLKRFYQHENSNVHRGAHTLAARSTDAYEGVRATVARFLGAASPQEIVFVRGATEAINLAAQSWGRANVGAGDEIAVSHLEHHANIVPWQRLAEEKGATLKVLPVDDDGQIVLAEAARLIGPRTKLLALTQVSNALGTVTPVQALVALAHAAGAKVLVDGAQAVSHLRVNVRSLDADFYVFSGHKVFGPTGIGVLYGKKALLDAMPPWQGGGNMIKDVTFEKTEYHDAPARFEAGTGNIAGAVGLGAALDYVEALGREAISLYEHALLEYAIRELSRVPGLRLIGTAREKASVLSFTLAGHKTGDVAAALAREGVAVRGGHHCAQPILRRFGLESTVRPSLAFYNHCADVDALTGVLRRLAGGRKQG